MSVYGLQVEFVVGGVKDPGLRRLTAAFERAGDEVKDLGKHVLPKVVPVLEAAAKEQFESEGSGPAAGKWAPLSEQYAAWKAKTFGPMPILQRTRELMRGMTDGSASSARRDINDTTLIYGTRGVGYASFHQLGTAKMPARPPIDPGSDIERALVRATAAGIREAVKAGSDGVLESKGDES